MIIKIITLFFPKKELIETGVIEIAGKQFKCFECRKVRTV